MSSHASMCMVHHQNNTPIHQTRHWTNKYFSSYHNEFNDLEYLIALNECNYEVNNQLKADWLDEVSKLNVVNCKDKQK